MIWKEKELISVYKCWAKLFETGSEMEPKIIIITVKGKVKFGSKFGEFDICFMFWKVESFWRIP